MSTDGLAGSDLGVGRGRRPNAAPARGGARARRPRGPPDRDRAGPNLQNSQFTADSHCPVTTSPK